MSYLVANVPAIKCYVRAEYLYDHERGHGDLEPCYWLTVKSIKGQAFRIEAMLINYGAIYDKLPISAFVWQPVDDPLPLDHLQIWDCLAYDIAIIEKSNLRGLKVKFFGRDQQYHWGNYLFTIDQAAPDHNTLNVGFAETADEHKSFNVIQMDSGQYAVQPNNRCLWYDVSMVPKEMKTPDFKICTKIYTVENTQKWSTEQDTWFYNQTLRSE